MSERSFGDSIASVSAAIILGAIIIAVAIFWVGGHPSGTIQTGTLGTGTAQAAANTGTTPTQAAAPNVDSSKVKTAGEPFIGNPNAPVTVAYWFDYQCPFCKQNEQNVMPSIVSDYVNSGKVKVVFKDFAFLGPDSTTLALNARAVWEVDPNNFYAWHKAIFDNQGQEGSGWASTQAKIDAITEPVLGASETAQVDSLVVSKASTYQSEIDADKAEGGTFGVTGTPAMIIGKQFINGAEPYSNVQSAIQTAIGQ